MPVICFSSRDDAGLLSVSIGDFDPVSFQTVWDIKSEILFFYQIHAIHYAEQWFKNPKEQIYT